MLRLKISFGINILEFRFQKENFKLKDNHQILLNQRLKPVQSGMFEV